SWWSPTLYFKAILHAITWSDQLAQAMESHGYVEDRARTSVHQIALTTRDWLILIVSIILIQIITFALP
ncbi:energy-coupling factor transporter transmembrane protein EcfT, partial [Limosilactobacillus mucosae]|nr:energy-coupling factor transporter transmembrane protein EcfT [Limosilactobacillus mucosae]